MKSIVTLALMTGALATAPLFTIAQEPDAALVARAKAILDKAPLIDTHNDLPSMLLERYSGDIAGLDLGIAHPELCADVPRLRTGGVGAQYWSVFTDSANMKTNRSLFEALRGFDVVLAVIRSRPELELALTADDVERIHRAGRIASLIGVEGGHMIEESLAVLRIFHKLGARYMTLTHWDNVPWADAATDRTEHDGLTEFGETVVREMNRLGMFVDLSHVSPDTMRDALRVSRAPVIFSPSNAAAICARPRNVPDECLGCCRERRGRPRELHQGVRLPRQPRMAEAPHGCPQGPAVAPRRPKGRERWHRRLGEGEPAPGRNHRGGRRPHRSHPQGRWYRLRRDRSRLLRRGGDVYGPRADDVTRYPYLFAELLRRGYSEEDLLKVAGRNHLRAMRQMEKAAERR